MKMGRPPPPFLCFFLHKIPFFLMEDFCKTLFCSKILLKINQLMLVLLMHLEFREVISIYEGFEIGLFKCVVKTYHRTQALHCFYNLNYLSSKHCKFSRKENSS